MKRLALHVCVLVVIVLSGKCAIGAQTPALSPSAQKALDAGIASAKAGDYLAAIKSFDEARKIAPDAPAIYFNLGLAESKIPGRELRAVCALEAYLVLTPNAENAVAVRGAIGNLESASRANIDKMIEILKIGFVGLKSPPNSYGRQPEVSLPVLYLKYGQPEKIDDLIKSFKRIDQYYTKPDDARLALLKVLCTMKRLDEAAKQAELIVADQRSNANSEMARAYIEARRFREAKSYLEKNKNSDMYLLLDLAVAENKAGLTDDAEARFQDAKLISTAQAKQDPWWGIRDIPDFAFARWRMGQKDAAESLLKQALSEIEAFTKGESHGGKSPNAVKVLCLLSCSFTLDAMGRHTEAVKIMDKAEKFLQDEIRDQEEGVLIQSESTYVFNHYVYTLKEWKRAETFLSRPYLADYKYPNGVKYMFPNDGLEGLRRFFAKRQQENASSAARSAATDAVNKTIADPSASPAQRAAAWMQYSDSFMTDPIFTTDFNVMIKNLVDYTPPSDDADKPRTIFARVEEPAEALVDALNNIHAMRERRPIITFWPI